MFYLKMTKQIYRLRINKYFAGNHFCSAEEETAEICEISLSCLESLLLCWTLMVLQSTEIRNSRFLSNDPKNDRSALSLMLVCHRNITGMLVFFSFFPPFRTVGTPAWAMRNTSLLLKKSCLWIHHHKGVFFYSLF